MMKNNAPTWEDLSVQEKSRVSKLIRDRAFSAFINDVKAAGSWLGIKEESAAIIVYINGQREYREREIEK